MADKSLIIIGAGMAGLAAGCYGQMNGYRTHIFEQHTLPGGLCTGWTRKGYTFDGCLHWLVGSGEGKMLNRLWRELGALQGKRIFDFSTFYVYHSADGRTFHCYADPDRLEQELLRLSPADRPVIEEVTSAIRTVKGFSAALTALQDGSLAQKLVRGPKLVAFPGYARRWGKVTIQELSARFSDPFLRQAFLAYYPDQMAAHVLFFTMAWFAERNAGLPEGGSLAFAQSVAARYKELGGTITYRAPVATILVEGERAVGVHLADGSEQRADWVISAADGRSTIYDMLGGRFLDAAVERPYKEGWPTFTSAVQVSFGLNMDLRAYPHMQHWELDSPVAAGPDAIETLYLRHHCYDPSLAPAGKSVASVLYEADIAPWRALAQKGQADYEAIKEEVGRVIADLVAARIPGFKDAVEVVDVATPLTIERYTANWNGSIEGWLPTPTSLKLDGSDAVPHTLPGLRQFYMTGQWVAPGGGVPVALDARNVIKRICKEDGKKFRATLPECESAPPAEVAARRPGWLVSLRTLPGKPVVVGDTTVTPESQALSVRLPFGGFVWHRPTAALVTRGGRQERLRIVDLTRVGQLGLLGLTLAFSLVVWFFRRRRKEQGQ